MFLYLLLFLIVVFLTVISGILLVFWGVSGKLWIGKLLWIMWMSVIIIALTSMFINWLNSKTVLEHDDYHGDYIIKRDYFQGTQTDWQYNHFRFKITEEDSIFFYYTDREKILKTYKGIVKTTNEYNYSSARLIIEMNQPSHHILSDNPTTYRSAWDFYLVFESPHFYNVFFEKGTWKRLD